MANETLGASFSIDVTDLKAGLSQANRMIRESESEFKAAAAGMDNWQESQEGLTAKVKSLNTITDLQKKKVGALQQEYKGLIAGGLDPASKEAVELRTKINNETAALNKNEAELEKQKQALKELEEQSKKNKKATDETGSSFEGLKAAGGIAVKAIAAVGAACVSAVGAFFGLAESTREARKLMAQLETSFESAGHSAEAAESTFTELYSVMGDEGAATEAAQQLAKFAKDEESLAASTRILTGVMAEYGNSIPTEGLAEGMAASAAMGSVQGVLADALEWQGVNLDKFNAKLGKLKTEEERAAYIQKTLTDLYGESADAYRENNAEVIAAQKAQAQLNDAMNELGAIAEPIMTTLKTMSADLLTSIMPFVQLMGEGLAGAMSGAEGAAESMAAGLNGLIETALQRVVDLAPFVIETALAIIPTLLENLLGKLPEILQTLLTMVVKVAESLSGMLPTLIPVIISAVVKLAETLLDNVDLIIDAGIGLLMGLADGLVTALPQLIEKIPVIIDKAVSAIASNLPKLISAGIQLTVKLAEGLIKAIPQLISKLPQIIMSIGSGLKSYYSNLLDMGADMLDGIFGGLLDFKAIAKKIKEFGNSILKGIKDFFGIHSPSKVMADQVGKNLALGIGKGFTDNIAGVNKQITGAMNFGGGVGVVGNIGGRAGGGVVVYQTNNYAQAHSRIELYKTQQATAAAVRLAMQGA